MGGIRPPAARNADAGNGPEFAPLAEGDLEWADSVTGKPKAELLQKVLYIMRLPVVLRKAIGYNEKSLYMRDVYIERQWGN